jgi:hypothetical protein
MTVKGWENQRINKHYSECKHIIECPRPVMSTRWNIWTVTEHLVKDMVNRKTEMKMGECENRTGLIFDRSNIFQVMAYASSMSKWACTTSVILKSRSNWKPGDIWCTARSTYHKKFTRELFPLEAKPRIALGQFSIGNCSTSWPTHTPKINIKYYYCVRVV